MSALSLAHPLLAAGILGVAAPIIIHFIFRRRSRRLDFSAMRFVLLSYKKVLRRLIIQEYLLLLCRCLMVALLALALAGPLLSRMVQGFNRGDKPLAVIFILDNSLSMTRDHGGRTLLDQAKDEVGHWLSQVRPGDRVGLIDGARLTSEGPDSDPDQIAKALARTGPAYAPARLNEALALASSQFNGLAYMDRMVIVLTDLQRASWTGPGEAGAGGPPLFVVDLAHDLKPKNLAVSDLAIKRGSLAREETAEVQAKLANYGAEDAAGVLLRVEVDGKVAAQGFVDAPAGESVDKSLVLTESPRGEGRLRIESDDGMPGDNTGFFHLQGGQEVRALVVDGDPGQSYLESETYFLDHALNPRLYARSRVSPRTVTVPEFASADLSGYQVVLLANVEKLAPKDMDRLKQFVSDGGGLFITLGDKVNADNYNAMFGDLLPRELRGVKLSYAGAQSAAEVRLMHLETPAPGGDSHQVLAVFRDAGQGDLGLAGFSKYFLVQQEVVPKSQVILRLTDGTPIMVEGRYGLGSVIVLASTADRAWNDLCIHPTYLPLIQQTVQYLANALLREDSGRLTAGQVIELPAPAEAQAARVLGPDGQISDCELIEEIGARRFRIGRAELPGIYYIQFKRAGASRSSRFLAKEADRVLVINPDPAESDLTRLDENEIKNRAGVSAVRVIVPGQSLDTSGAEGREIKPYAGIILMLLAAAAVAERALARK